MTKSVSDLSSQPSLPFEGTAPRGSTSLQPASHRISSAFLQMRKADDFTTQNLDRVLSRFAQEFEVDGLQMVWNDNPKKQRWELHIPVDPELVETYAEILPLILDSEYLMKRTRFIPPVEQKGRARAFYLADDGFKSAKKLSNYIDKNGEKFKIDMGELEAERAKRIVSHPVIAIMGGRKDTLRDRFHQPLAGRMLNATYALEDKSGERAVHIGVDNLPVKYDHLDAEARHAIQEVASSKGCSLVVGYPYKFYDEGGQLHLRFDMRGGNAIKWSPQRLSDAPRYSLGPLPAEIMAFQADIDDVALDAH